MRHHCIIIYLFTIFTFALNLSAAEQIISLDGAWQFTIDPLDKGLREKWFDNDFVRSQWQEVIIPHTWQVMPDYQDYYGIAWYNRRITVDLPIDIHQLKLEFDAVYRDVQVWVNGRMIGEHLGSGWTPFAFLLDAQRGKSPEIIITLRVDNRHAEQALPYLNSFDWAADGGIIRSARLRLLPETYIDQILVNTEITSDLTDATIGLKIKIGASRALIKHDYLFFTILDPLGKTIYHQSKPFAADHIPEQFLTYKIDIPQPCLWHFDLPQLYLLRVYLLRDKQIMDQKEVSIGLRTIQVRDGYYYLNNEPMRLMGLEWMPGSDPRYGMAESNDYMRGVLTDMKQLNSIISRFHWQQDAAVFEFCDRYGMLLQEEVPAWGSGTRIETLSTVQSQQLHEMILAHYNHPSIYAWGLCNEIRGQEQAGHTFIGNGIDMAKALDPSRLLTYASNSLQQTPAKDAAQYMDFIEWNDYYESWYGGSLLDLNDNLQRISQAFPSKSVVISEYGLCECDPKNPVGDLRRIEILKTHTDIYRQTKCVAGAIFFDYNDYRTHIGDKGWGAFQQRVHGVVDIFNRRKPSWDALKAEMSPVKKITIALPVIKQDTVYVKATIITRSLETDLPAYTLRKYYIIWIAVNRFDQPIASGRKLLPDLPPGTSHEVGISWYTFPDLKQVSLEIFRPTNFSVIKKVLVIK
jgi:beta-galactosidase